MHTKRVTLVTLLLLAGLGFARPAFAQTCPTEDPAIDTAKSNKLFLYFPTSSDSNFPNYTANAGPVPAFDVAALSPGIGTTAQLIDQIHTVVVDDYCEFNVQVLATTTNPASMASPPAKRVTVAIGADNTGAWGQAQEVDIGDTIAVDFARVWAGTYTSCEGGTLTPGFCSPSGALTGANATLAHWAQAIGGTAAHEGGHTYGLSHTDDDPPDDQGMQQGPAPTPGEDAFNRHLMPAGYNLSGADRANYRRHFSNRGYGLLASNVGLSVETMHNWDLVNPNAESASSLTMDFLSTQSSMSLTWAYGGNLSPWLNPTVSASMGTTVFKGVTYNKFRLTWSASNPAWHTSAPGVVAGGAVFHIGAAFAGVDFNTPDPIIIQDVTLLDAGHNALNLHPRLPSYDAGSLDGASGDAAVNFNAPAGAPQMRMVQAAVYQLPRLATIESMVGEGRPLTRDGEVIRPWTSVTCPEGELGERGLRCVFANRKDAPHVSVIHRLGEPNVIDCKAPGLRDNPPTRVADPGPHDSVRAPDYEGPYCAGEQYDPFPSATVYVVARFVDPQAKHYDPVKKDYVTGPLTTKVFYQFAGTRKLDGRGKGGGTSSSGGSSGSSGGGTTQPPGDHHCTCLCLVLLFLGLLFLLILLALWLRRGKN